ncbi:MAG TPA: hypothetical protein VFH15_05770 [Pyrinomonadaceae bacterium]|nr:hypothetical protein [Pyrinomonadaceae bacterium]
MNNPDFAGESCLVPIERELGSEGTERTIFNPMLSAWSLADDSPEVRLQQQRLQTVQAQVHCLGFAPEGLPLDRCFTSDCEI